MRGLWVGMGGGGAVGSASVDGQVLAATKTKENAGIREYALNNS